MTPAFRRDPFTARWVLVGGAPSAVPALAEPVPIAVEAHPPILDRKADVERDRGTMYEVMSGAGRHEVVIEDDRQGSSLADLGVDRISAVLILWRERMRAFADDRRWRQLGVVRSHRPGDGRPHAEIFALPFVPASIREKMVAFGAHLRRHGTCLSCDTIRAEREAKERFLVETLRHAAIAPFAPRSPHELYLLPKGHHSDFWSTGDAELADLARLLELVSGAIRRALDDPPYDLVVETAPLDAGADLREFHWHMSLRPLVTAAPIASLTDHNPTPPEVSVRLLSPSLGEPEV
jgi:UDPglucose--hexose-1-phosphate uridylyltransferase